MNTGSWDIEVHGLTKTFGTVEAVTDLDFTVSPGTVTAFLGPNGAGKTTTMRMLLGLVTPTSGRATIGGLRYTELPRPAATVGAVLDTSGFHPDHTARDHLSVYARLGGFARSRVREVMDLTGVTPFAGRRTRALSTGMRRRLHLATALLGDPRVLLLDEPGNGLDPEGIAWLRRFLRELAAEGRTVLVSSHVLSEVEQMAERVVMIRDGRLVAAGAVADLYGEAAVRVRSPQAGPLTTALLAAYPGTVRVEALDQDTLRIHGLTTAGIAADAAARGIPLHEITPERPTLEHAFLHLTGHDQGDTR
ncbi:ATP-binding cassette domain-containing protein [Microtetraspora sp. NBRC 16547]|uniref:ABC transporter ATP-binding protein n=1 Tax=Microtetraspora sp. NBRC 16547 TaxID=3030993 RepID=UPI0024A4F9A9|nr:ATP-binding cassette domain-containing protein [Microtetraspora sp. NBRC 16547]GLW96639.1 multidrug ABC transporter ATP-binding protein [Microtetraspora sp. NBRC 16547]